jgi:hypothetical protein
MSRQDEKLLEVQQSGGFAQHVEPRAAAGRHDSRRSRDLAQEGGERVLAGDLEPLSLDPLKPLLVVDGLSRLQSGSKNLQGDLLQSLTAEAPVELLDAQLAGHAEGLCELVEESLVCSRLGGRLIGEAL